MCGDEGAVFKRQFEVGQRVAVSVQLSECRGE